MTVSTLGPYSVTAKSGEGRVDSLRSPDSALRFWLQARLVLISNRLVEVIAKSIRSDDKEDLKPMTIPLVYPPIACLNAFGQEFFFHTVDICH